MQELGNVTNGIWFESRTNERAGNFTFHSNSFSFRFPSICGWFPMMIKFIVEIFVRAFDLFTTHSFIMFKLSKFSSSIIERVSCFVLGSKVHSFSFPHFDALHVFPIFSWLRRILSTLTNFSFKLNIGELELRLGSFKYYVHLGDGEGGWWGRGLRNMTWNVCSNTSNVRSLPWTRQSMFKMPTNGPWRC